MGHHNTTKHLQPAPLPRLLPFFSLCRLEPFIHSPRLQFLSFVIDARNHETCNGPSPSRTSCRPAFVAPVVQPMNSHLGGLLPRWPRQELFTPSFYLLILSRSHTHTPIHIGRSPFLPSLSYLPFLLLMSLFSFSLLSFLLLSSPLGFLPHLSLRFPAPFPYFFSFIFLSPSFSHFFSFFSLYFFLFAPSLHCSLPLHYGSG